MYKEVEIDDLNKLANFIIENEYNKIAIESPEFTDTKDLFFFLNNRQLYSFGQYPFFHLFHIH